MSGNLYDKLKTEIPTDVDPVANIRQFWIEQRNEHLALGHMTIAVELSHLIAWLSFAQKTIEALEYYEP